MRGMVLKPHAARARNRGARLLKAVILTMLALTDRRRPPAEASQHQRSGRHQLSDDEVVKLCNHILEFVDEAINLQQHTIVHAARLKNIYEMPDHSSDHRSG